MHALLAEAGPNATRSPPHPNTWLRERSTSHESRRMHTPVIICAIRAYSSRRHPPLLVTVGLVRISDKPKTSNVPKSATVVCRPFIRKCTHLLFTFILAPGVCMHDIRAPERVVALIIKHAHTTCSYSSQGVIKTMFIVLPFARVNTTQYIPVQIVKFTCVSRNQRHSHPTRRWISRKLRLLSHPCSRQAAHPS